MSHTFSLTEGQYEVLQTAAQAAGMTPEGLLARWIEELRGQQPAQPHYDTVHWFKHLGATDEQIAEARRLAREREREHADS